MKKLFLVLILLSFSFPEQVARRCKGEASFALAACSCTVKNRLTTGWVQHKVLSAYYAPDIRVTGAETETVARVLDGRTYCDPRYYFIYSKEDVAYLQIKQEPLAVISNGKLSVSFYERWYKLRK